jgi:MFS family permease
MAVRFVHGSATAIMGPVMSATISDLAPPSRRATWLSTYSTMQGVGQALAPVIAGALIAQGRYDLAFAIAGLVGLAAPFLVARLTLPSAPHGGRSLRQAREGLLEVLRERAILVASATHATYYIVSGTMSAFLPLLARDRLGMSPAAIGLLFGAQTLVTLAIRPLIGMASDRLGRRAAIAAGLTTCAIGVGGVAVAASMSALSVAVLIYAGGVATTTAATSAYITDVAPRARFGAAHGVFGTIYDIGDASGPLVGGLLVGLLGYAATFQIMAAVSLSAALLFVALSRAPNAAAVRATLP